MYYLTGQAKAWYSSLPDDTKADVNAVLELFKKRFDGSDAALAVTQIRQAPCESVSDYTTRYLEATCQQAMPELWKITTYVDGLKPAIRRIVKPQKLTDVDDARQAALRAENSEMDNVEVSAITSPVESQMAHLAKQMQDLMLTVSQLAALQKQQQQQQQQQYYNTAASQMPQPPTDMGYGYPDPHQPQPQPLQHQRHHSQQQQHHRQQQRGRPHRGHMGKGRNNSSTSHSHQPSSQNFNSNYNNNH